MDKEKTSLFTKSTKIHKIGGSLMIVLPSFFCQRNNIEEDDEIGLVVSDKIIKLVLMPKKIVLDNTNTNSAKE